MSDLQAEIAELLKKRTAIDVELEVLRGDAERRLQAAQADMDALATALSATQVFGVERPMHQPQPKRPRGREPIDETDAGNGVREIEENHSAQSFKDELAELRERTQMKRRRL
jgi:hypothetical protein